MFFSVTIPLAYFIMQRMRPKAKTATLSDLLAPETEMPKVHGNSKSWKEKQDLKELKLEIEKENPEVGGGESCPKAETKKWVHPMTQEVRDYIADLHRRIQKEDGEKAM